MGGSRLQTVVFRRQAVRQGVALLAGVLVPYLVSLIVLALTPHFAYQFLFLYMPGLFLISYFGGLWPGVVSLITSTVLAGSVSVYPSVLALTTLQREVLPSLIFLFSGMLITLAGIQTSRYHADLREDIARSRRQKHHQAFLADIVTLVSRHRDRQSFAEAVCEALTNLPAAAAGLLLLNPRTAMLDPVAFSATDVARRERLASAFADAAASSGLPLLRRMVVAAEPLNSLNVRQLPDATPEGGRPWVEWLSPAGFDTGLFLPLLAGADALGMLTIFTDTKQAGEADAAIVARAAADRVALGVQQIRARTVRQQRDHHAAFLADLMLQFARERDLAAQLNILASHCAALYGDWCAISLVNPKERDARPAAVFHADAARVSRLQSAFDAAPIPLDHPFAAELFGRRQPQLLTPENPSGDTERTPLPLAETLFGPLAIREVLAVPIFGGDDRLGILWMLAESVRGWDDEELRLASLIADRAGLAIATARLAESERRALEEAAREARRVNAVARVISIAASALDPGEAFDELADALQLLLPFDRVAVTLPADHPDSLITRYVKGRSAGAARVTAEEPKAGTVRGWVLDQGTAFIRDDTFESHEFTEDTALAGAGIRSYVVVPMSVGGNVSGTLDFGHHEPGFYSQGHLKLVQPIADQLAITISRFQLLDQTQRRVGQLSETLQRALLPTDLPNAPFVSLGAIYRPADTEVKVGGDWYDAILLADDFLLVSMGDVAGHGMTAATVMGQVRHIVRAYAVEGQTPGRILTSLNRLLCNVAGSLQVSLWVAAFDPLTGTLVYSGAGHPPALAATDTDIAPLPSGAPPLGVSMTTAYREAKVTLQPGSRLVAYTDGLIEVSRDVIVGERRLREAILATRYNPPERAVEALVQQALGDAVPNDDVALLILDVSPVDAPVSATLQASPENLARVRRLVRTYAQRLGVPDHRSEEMVIAVGEAALNAVEHAYRGIRGNLVIRGELTGTNVTMTVKDFGQWRPQIERGRGRGTKIMQGFSDGVKTHTTSVGTTVQLTWAVDRLPRPHPAG